MDNDSVAQVLADIGILLDLKGENPFKSRAYASAARTLESLAEPVATVIAEQRLGELRGIGAALQSKIVELVTTGRLAYYEDLKASLPAGLRELLRIPGLGPRKVRALYTNLQVETVAALEAACREGKVAGLAGFGEKTQAKILEGIAFQQRHASRHLLSEVLPIAEALIQSLRDHPEVVRVSPAGSLRRWKEVIGDLDLLASSRNARALLNAFASQPGVQSVLGLGDTKASVLFQGGLQADLRVVSDEEYPFALAYFTGSKEHNIIMRQRAIQRGLRLNEYGLFRSKEETRDPSLRVPCRTEEEIYHALDLAYVPPELREDSGEFDLAEAGEIPRLVEWTELRGSLHNHSTWSDGRQTLEEIVETARGLGLSYWAVTDHSKSSVIANGLDEARLEKQLKAIGTINANLEAEGSEFRLLSGSEVDILADGRLDFPDELLARLDVVVASVHQVFTQDEATMTRRLVRAAQNPFVHALGHMTGRLLLERDACKVNHREVIDACARTGTWIELNASPLRLDMDWRHWHYACQRGVPCVINCDAHREAHFAYLRLGAGIARKGRLRKEDVVNTLPLAELRNALGRKRSSFGRSAA